MFVWHVALQEESDLQIHVLLRKLIWNQNNQAFQKQSHIPNLDFLGSILVFGVYFLVANYIMEHWDEVCRAVKA